MKKKKDKIDHKRPKKIIRKPPPNPQKVMSFPYSWNFFLFVLGNSIFLKVALLWSGNLKYPNACFPRWSQLEELPPSLDVPGLDWLESVS